MFRFNIATIALLALVLILPAPSRADNKSDYGYQYSQYQKYFSDFKILKKDYLQNPTLENQQKTIISAKQTLRARDLTKASYAGYLSDLIRQKNIDYESVNRRLADLATAREFYLARANASQSLITPSELASFSASYSVDNERHDFALRFGNLYNKLSQLVRFQIECRTALDTLTPLLPADKPNQLRVRLEDLSTLHAQINARIEELSAAIDSEETLTIMNTSYFPKKTEALNQIRALQSRWIDLLVDVDLNYAQL